MTPHAEQLTALIPTYFNARKAIHHYRSMAASTWGARSANQISIKKLFYALRAASAVHWVHQTSTMPPTCFAAHRSRTALNPDLLTAIEEAEEAKQDAAEGAIYDIPHPIHRWIEETLAQANDFALNAPTPAPSWDALNDLFRETVTR